MNQSATTIPQIATAPTGHLPYLVRETAPVRSGTPAAEQPLCTALGGQCDGRHEAENPERHVGPLFHVALSDDPRGLGDAEAQLIQMDAEPGFPLQHELYVEIGRDSVTLTTPREVAQLRHRLARLDDALLSFGEQLAALKGTAEIRFDASCGERRPGWLDDADPTLILQCGAHYGHEGDHRDILGRTWPQQVPAELSR
jgi:hypothetical protein